MRVKTILAATDLSKLPLSITSAGWLEIVSVEPRDAGVLFDLPEIRR